MKTSNNISVYEEEDPFAIYARTFEDLKEDPFWEGYTDEELRVEVYLLNERLAEKYGPLTYRKKVDTISTSAIPPTIDEEYRNLDPICQNHRKNASNSPLLESIPSGTTGETPSVSLFSSNFSSDLICRNHREENNKH